MTLELLKYSFIVIQFFLLFFWGYWLIIGFFGFGKPKQQKDHAPKKRFLILVPAHNEEKVVGQLVENLKNMKYPKDLYEVCVIADNCTDETAKISRELGASVVEHTSAPNEPKGKPYGIKYAVDQYGDRLTKDFDGIAFFDADNLVSLNYLEEMNNHLMNGDKLIQCYLDSKNPDDNWVTLSYATSYYYMNRSWQLAKSKIGLPNAVGGTGFCVDTKLFTEVGWTARSLTEDLEFTMQCILVGESAKWCHNARVYDEKPESFVASCVQRLRWARGHWDVCMKYTPKLISRFIRKGDIAAFDGALYLFNPGKIILATLTGAMTYFSLINDLNWFSPIMPWQVWAFFLLYQLFYIGLSLVLDASKKINVIKGFLSLIVFNASYVPLFFWSLLTMKNKTWVRTDHSRSIAIGDMDSVTADKDTEIK
jgi:cellulose synthase/poly-beta-1,6-N-acetylglucosamine synthase-like glycosyltransferase